MQRRTLLSLAVSAALGGVLPAVYAQNQDTQRGTGSEVRTQASEQQERFFWDRNEFRDRDFARNDHGSRHAGWRDHDRRGHDGDWRDHQHVDRQEIRQDWREIREDRARLQAELADRQHNREQLRVARAIGDQPGVEWERNQIRDNNRDIRAIRGELRDDYRELRSDLRDLHRQKHGDFRHAHGRDHRHGHHHVDFRHDGRGDWRDRQHVDWREIRGDIREIREDRARLQAELADRQHNREQLNVARAIGDRPGVEWERNQIRDNNRDIRAIRAELREDRRELRQDLRDFRQDRHDHHKHFGDHKHRHHQHVRNDHGRHDGHKGRDVKAHVQAKADVKAKAEVKPEVKK